AAGPGSGVVPRAAGIATPGPQGHGLRLHARDAGARLQPDVRPRPRAARGGPAAARARVERLELLRRRGPPRPRRAALNTRRSSMSKRLVLVILAVLLAAGGGFLFLRETG